MGPVGANGRARIPGGQVRRNAIPPAVPREEAAHDMNTQDRVKDAGSRTQAMARLLALVAERGYLIRSDVVDELPAEYASPEELESVLAALAQVGIDVLEGLRHPSFCGLGACRGPAY
ncbi:hypothetical protein D9M68_381730 [compost metagenome]